MKNLRSIWINLLAALLLAVPAFATIPAISGYTTQADGNTVTAAIWNSQIGGIYAYINTNLVAALNTFTAKGDVLVYDGSAIQKLAVGTNGQCLQADSTAATGTKWASIATVTSLTTKGDLLGFDTGLNRIPVGTDGYILTSRASSSLGVAWEAPTTIPTGGIMLWGGAIVDIPTGWALCDGQVHSGTTTPNLQGLFVVGAGNVSPAATGGAGLMNAGGPHGDTSAGAGLGPSHTRNRSALQRWIDRLSPCYE